VEEAGVLGRFGSLREHAQSSSGAAGARRCDVGAAEAE
jgi:hypothetical protein